MYLSGQQLKKLQEALINAFPNPASLEHMLTFELNKNLKAIAGEGSLQDVVFKLIQAANSQGWVKELIIAALNSNSGNPKLKAFAKKIGINNPPISLNNHLSKILAVIVGVVSTTVFLSQLPKSAENTGANTNPTKISTTPEPTPETTRSTKDFYDLAISEYKKGEYDEAIDFYNKAIELDPNNADYYYGRGLARFKSRDNTGAIQDSDKAIELNPKNYKYYALRGYARRNLKDNRGAILDYTEAIRYRKYANYYEIIAELYLELGNKDKAVDYYQKAIQSYNQNGKEKESRKAQEELDFLCQNHPEPLRRCKTI